MLEDFAESHGDFCRFVVDCRPCRVTGGRHGVISRFRQTLLGEPKARNGRRSATSLQALANVLLMLSKLFLHVMRLVVLLRY